MLTHGSNVPLIAKLCPNPSLSGNTNPLELRRWELIIRRRMLQIHCITSTTNLELSPMLLPNLIHHAGRARPLLFVLLDGMNIPDGRWHLETRVMPAAIS
jgi:hypothetical protein